MKCFVASAFDREDVDKAYDLAIRPVLKEFKVTAKRVDRIEHNDDIDDHIIALIEECDICIADLTYARPSVYFEAGYVQGLGKPVVYTVRTDHFRPKENDHEGVRKVHFDLQMRNIIGWTDNIPAFKKRLRSRIRHVIKPILKQKGAVSLRRQEEKRFASLAVQTRLRELNIRCHSILEGAGFKECPMWPPALEKQPTGIIAEESQIVRFRVAVLVCDSIRKTSVDRAIEEAVNLTRFDSKSQKHENVCIVISLQKKPVSSLERLLPRWQPVGKGAFVIAEEESGDFFRGPATIVFLDGIRSLSELAERIECMEIPSGTNSWRSWALERTDQASSSEG